MGGDPSIRGAHKHLGGVIRVVVHLPESAPGGDPGVLQAPRPQFGTVIGAVADADPIGVDLAPLDRQQFQVVLPDSVKGM